MSQQSAGHTSDMLAQLLWKCRQLRDCVEVIARLVALSSAPGSNARVRYHTSSSAALPRSDLLSVLRAPRSVSCFVESGVPLTAGFACFTWPFAAAPLTVLPAASFKLTSARGSKVSRCSADRCRFALGGLMESSAAVCLARFGRSERVCGAGESLDRFMAASEVRDQTRGLRRESLNHRACGLQMSKCLWALLMRPGANN